MESLLIGVLVATRITAAIFTAPVLGSAHVPIRFRVILSGLLTIFTLPVLVMEPIATQSWLSLIFCELAIGISLGLGISILFAAAQMAGAVMSQMASIPNMEVLPNLVSPVGSLFCMLSIAVFVLMNGPEMMVAALLDTFAEIPPGSTLELSSLDELAVGLLRQSFLLTLRGVAPSIAAILISTLVVGMLGRTYPQLNLLEFGVGSNLAIMMLALLFTVSGCVWLFIDDVQAIQQTITDGLRVAADAAAAGTDTVPLEQAGHHVR